MSLKKWILMMSSSRSKVSSTRTNKVIYIDHKPWPIFIGWCPTKRAWNKEMKRLGIKNEPYPETDARCSFFDTEDKTHIVLVTLNEKHDTHEDLVAIHGLLIHEVIHIWQAIVEDIGEKDPHASQELEAYSIQALFQQIAWAYNKTRKQNAEEAKLS